MRGGAGPPLRRVARWEVPAAGRWWGVVVGMGQQEAAAGEEEGERGLFKGRGGVDTHTPLWGEGLGDQFWGSPPTHAQACMGISGGRRTPSKTGGCGGPPSYFQFSVAGTSRR